MTTDRTLQWHPSRLRENKATEAERSRSTGSSTTSLAEDQAAQARLCQNTHSHRQTRVPAVGKAAGRSGVIAGPRTRRQETDKVERLLWEAPCRRGTTHCRVLKALQGLKAQGHHSACAPLIPPEVLLLRLLVLQVVHRQCTTSRFQVQTLLPHGTMTAHQSLQQLSRVLRVLQLGGLKGNLLRNALRRHAQGSRPLLQAERPAQSVWHRPDLALTHPAWAGLLARQRYTAAHHGSTWCTETNAPP